MSDITTTVTEAIKSGHHLIAIQSDQFIPLQAAFAEADPEGSDRPNISWDPEDGFLQVRNVLDDLPAAEELTDAFSFIEKFQGGAVFLIDGTNGVIADNVEAVRPRLKQLVAKTAVAKDLIVVLMTHVALPESLTRLVHWIGDAPAPVETKQKSAPSRQHSHPWKELQSLESTNTHEWFERIDNLSYSEISEMVQGGFHRDPLERVNELKSDLKQRFAQKDSIIDAISACAVAQVPCVLMGPPGTAKGLLIRTFCEGLGLTQSTANENSEPGARKYFEYQLTRFTTPEELFGPVHIQDLIDRQIYRRVTDGYLPTAHVAFLDELFKASSAILNTLLSILNERVFYNEGYAQKVPLTTIFAASNEPPQEESLGALFDRFPVRINCPAVENDKLSELHARSWEDSFDRHFSATRQSQRVVSCANDLRLLKKVSYVVCGGRDAPQGGGAFEKEFTQVFRMMRHEANISDRSLSLLYTYARASAMLAGRTVMTADDLDVFRHVVWGQEREFSGFFRQLKKNYQTST